MKHDPDAGLIVEQADHAAHSFLGSRLEFGAQGVVVVGRDQFFRVPRGTQGRKGDVGGLDHLQVPDWPAAVAEGDLEIDRGIGVIELVLNLGQIVHVFAVIHRGRCGAQGGCRRQQHTTDQPDFV